MSGRSRTIDTSADDERQAPPGLPVADGRAGAPEGQDDTVRRVTPGTVPPDLPEQGSRWLEGDTATTVAERFRRQVRSDPDKIAVAGRPDALSYAELDALSDRFAEALCRSGDPVGPGGRVALLLPHGGRLIAAALGVWKCGLAAVPLSPAEPSARLSEQRDLTGPARLIVAESLVGLAASAGFDPTQIVLDTGLPGALDSRRPHPADPDALAVLIATSGSTGRPKAVMHSHRTMLHNVLRYTNGLGVRSDDRVAWHAPLSGGQGLVTVWTALLNGATLCPFPMVDSGAVGFSTWLRECAVTVLDTLPSVLRHLIATLAAPDVAGIRLVRIASEPAFRTDYERFRTVFGPDCRLAHVLASSETGIIAQQVCEPGVAPTTERLAVGGPAEGIEVWLSGADGRQAGAGESGEVVVRSRYLSLGYWASGTSEQHRFTTVEGVRSFRTGDLAVWTADGLVMLGRQDLQVKVHGHRVQIDEVEAALMGQAAVSAAVVAPVEGVGGDTALAAHLVLRPGARLDRTALRAGLESLLPGYAVPTSFAVLDQLPLTVTGKVDRSRLAAPRPDRPRPAAAQDPPAGVEEQVARLWSRAFELDELDRTAGFLELGGDSLLAAVVGALANDEFGVTFDMAYFRSDPSIVTMADYLEEVLDAGRVPPGEAPPPLTRAGPLERAGLSFSQLAMWPAATNPHTPTRTNVAVPFRIRGALDFAALRRGLEHVVRRHDILRTNFEVRDGQPRAVVRPPGAIDLPLLDLRGDPDPELAATRILAADGDVPFDLASEPLLRFRLLRLADEEFHLLRVNHHLIADMWSWRIFLDELGRCYEAELAHQPCPLGDSPEFQYADQVAWEYTHFVPGSPLSPADIGWWAARFADWSGPPVALPFRRPLPSDESPGSGSVIRWGLPASSSHRLDEVGQHTHATFFMSRLALFGALLGLTTGSGRLAVNTLVTTRRRTELQAMIGPLMNRVTLPLEFSSAATFREWLGVVRETVTEVSSHSAIPRQRLRSDLAMRGVTIPDVPTLFLARYPLPEVRRGGLSVVALRRWCVDPGGFELGVTRRDESEHCWAAFDPASFDRRAVDCFLRDLRALAEAVGRDPDRPLADFWPAGDAEPARTQVS